ncbi:MAG: homoserine kinase [Bacteroidetes bacterium]|nr:homoserine kinase [Bacteroidota bacterium]
MKGEFNLKVIVPASTSNLGPGFDTLGLAVNRYMIIDARAASGFSIEVTGEGAGEIPADERNLTVVGIRKVLENLPDLHVSIHNGIPSCGGFGASGAAIIGGLLLANELSRTKLTVDEIYNLAVKIEGHPDNVSAALYGGLVVNARGSNGNYSRIKIAVDGKLKFVAVLPDSKVETEAARKLLPESVNLGDAVSNVQHSSLLVAAMASGNYEMIRHAVHDELHQKYRKELIPYFDQFSDAAMKNGALAYAVSGAGSSCVAFCLEDHKSVHKAFEDLIGELGLNWRAEVLEPVNKGAEVFTD